MISALILSLTLSHAAEKLPMRPQLNLEMAKKMMAAAEKYASGKKVPCAIAIADDTGYQLMMVRTDGVMLASTILAPEKAKSTVLFKRNSADLEDTINKGRTALTTAPGVLMQGGLTVMHEGRLLGAIAASCDVKDQDIPVAQAGLDAFKP